MPEIADGLVEIRGVAREPGYRSKIAVESHAQGVDPVGACVGPRGSRVRMVVSELRGEKIDIIPWNNEPARFVAKALSPARVREVYLDDEGREATVVVPDDQLALAIGKEGMNARLAARLTGWKIDITSDTEFAQQEADAAFGGGEPGDENDVSGRCAAVLSNGKRCPNASLPGSKYCGVPAHQELALHEADDEDNPIVAESEPELEALVRHRRARGGHRGCSCVRQPRAGGVPGRPGRRAGRRRGRDARQRRRAPATARRGRSERRHPDRGGQVERASRTGPDLRRLRPQGAAETSCSASTRSAATLVAGRRERPRRLHLPAPAVLRARRVAQGVHPHPAARPSASTRNSPVSTLDQLNG